MLLKEIYFSIPVAELKKINTSSGSINYKILIKWSNFETARKWHYTFKEYSEPQLVENNKRFFWLHTHDYLKFDKYE